MNRLPSPMHAGRPAGQRQSCVLVSILAAALVLAGCGGNTASTTPTDGTPRAAAASPIPDDVAVNSDLGAALDEVPVSSGSTASGDPVVHDQTIEQTWSVRDQDPQSVFVDFYEPQLEALGWEATSQLTEVGQGYSESWERDGTSLKIVSEAGQTATQTFVNVLLEGSAAPAP